MIAIQFASPISVTKITDIGRFAWFISVPGKIKNTVINGILLIAITTGIFAFVIATDMTFRTLTIMHTASAFPCKTIRFKIVPMAFDFL